MNTAANIIWRLIYLLHNSQLHVDALELQFTGSDYNSQNFRVLSQRSNVKNWRKKMHVRRKEYEFQTCWRFVIIEKKKNHQYTPINHAKSPGASLSRPFSRLLSILKFLKGCMSLCAIFLPVISKLLLSSCQKKSSISEPLRRFAIKDKTKRVHFLRNRTYLLIVTNQSRGYIKSLK